MVKIDLKSGFHQLPLHGGTANHNSIFYRGEKLSLTRLPMGHALAPSLRRILRRSAWPLELKGSLTGPQQDGRQKVVEGYVG